MKTAERFYTGTRTQSLSWICQKPNRGSSESWDGVLPTFTALSFLTVRRALPSKGPTKNEEYCDCWWMHFDANPWQTDHMNLNDTSNKHRRKGEKMYGEFSGRRRSRTKRGLRTGETVRGATQKKTQFFFDCELCVSSRQSDESERTMAMQLLCSHRILKWLARHESDKESERWTIQSVRARQSIIKMNCIGSIMENVPLDAIWFFVCCIVRRVWRIRRYGANGVVHASCVRLTAGTGCL